MKQRYYKVVACNRESGIMKSVIIPSKESSVEYTIGTWTRPKLGHRQFLYVFKSRSCARHFKKIWDHNYKWKMKIFECEVVNPAFEKIDEHGCLYGVRGEWRWNILPHGTVLADAVKLTKKIH
jgi:hypothetical protein